jgi:hypothetical protein
MTCKQKHIAWRLSGDAATLEALERTSQMLIEVGALSAGEALVRLLVQACEHEMRAHQHVNVQTTHC